MVDGKMQALEALRKDVAEACDDVPRALLKIFAEKLMGAEVDALCQAGYGERSADRVNQRNGYRMRRWDTRVGTVDLAIPKLRAGSYFPEALLEPRRRAEKALMAAVVEAYVQGVSTRRVEQLVKTMGLEGMSKSQVSRLAESLDADVEAFRERPLGESAYTYLWLDATMHKCREGGRVLNVATVIAVGVNDDGLREVLGVDIFPTESGAGWESFLRGLVDRGLRDVQLVVSDAHCGLRDAIAKVLQESSWQRCRTHFMRNLLSQVQRNAQDAVATIVRSIFAQPNRNAVAEQHSRVVAQLAEMGFDQASHLLTDARDDVLAFSAFPKEHWKQIWSNNPLERLNKEIKRRTRVVGVFPNRAAIIRLVGALLAEENDEWAECRRYMNPKTLTKARLKLIDGGKNPKTKPKRRRRIAAA